MTTGDFDSDAFPENPEIVIGLVAPIGTPLKFFTAILESELKNLGYKSLDLKLSDYARLADPEQVISDTPSFERYDKLMTLGNRMREITARNDILALFAAARISAERPETDPRHLTKTAFIANQLKHPDEVFRLRRIYGDSFILIGLYCPKYLRHQHLLHVGMDDGQASWLINRDEDEVIKHGQQVSDTYHLADVFIEVRGEVTNVKEKEEVAGELGRFFDLLFGQDIVTPTRDEYGMFLANAAAIRSSSLARQVGAAIVSPEGDVVSLGTNEVPSAPGGLYWGDEVDERGESRDARDHVIGYDTSDKMKFQILEEILPHLDPAWAALTPEEKTVRLQEIVRILRGTRVMSLTEFVRAVHAEMEAVSAAARAGLSVRGSTLYSTTFPCHGCAKHIVAAGIWRVVYIEPYPKSLALEMHKDSIELSGEEGSNECQREPGKEPTKVCFEPFVGVAPRRYQDLFSRVTAEGRKVELKDVKGEVKKEGFGLRLPSSPLSYVIREDMAARQLRTIREKLDELRRGSTG